MTYQRKPTIAAGEVEPWIKKAARQMCCPHYSYAECIEIISKAYESRNDDPKTGKKTKRVQ